MSMRTKALKWCVAAGLLSQVILWLALTIWLVGLSRSLSVAAGSPEGDVATVSAILERATVVVSWGQTIGVLGFLLLLVAVLSSERATRWVWWSGLVSSMIQFFLFPIGTMLGGIGLLLFIRRFRQSDEKSQNKAPPTSTSVTSTLE